MCIMEIHGMDVSSINKKKWQKNKANNDQEFCFSGGAEIRAILNGSTKCCFKIFLKFSYEEE